MNRTIVGFALLLLTACANGEYRLPYSDGVDVLITADIVTHSGPPADMYDMKAVQPPAFLRAAAGGWVRFIEDGNSTSGGGNNNYVWIEHPFPYCQNPNDPDRATWPGKPLEYDQTCRPCTRRYCNEWTVYAHMARGSVTGSLENSANLSEGDWVEAGQLLGVESDIGLTDGRHLHWHVAVIDPEWVPSPDGDYESQLGSRRPELIPLVCTAAGKRILWRDRTYTASPCPRDQSQLSLSPTSRSKAALHPISVPRE
jgi:hypothetical protein